MPKGRSAHQPMTPERRRQFLETLRTTGSVVEAARVATPRGTGRQAGYSTFRRLREVDPSWAEEVADALAEAQAQLETVLLDRILHPPKRPVYVGGKIIGWVEDRNSSDKLLLRSLQRLDPSWADRRHHDVTGQVLHEHAHRHEFALRAEHIDLLAPAEQGVFLALVAKIYEHMEDNDHGQRRPPLRPALPAASAAGDEVPSGPAD